MSGAPNQELNYEEAERQRQSRIEFLETMKKTVSEWIDASMAGIFWHRTNHLSSRERTFLQGDDSDSKDSDSERECNRHIQRAAATCTETPLYRQLMQLELTENHLRDLIQREFRGSSEDSERDQMRYQFASSPDRRDLRRSLSLGSSRIEGKSIRRQSSSLDRIPEEYE